MRTALLLLSWFFYLLVSVYSQQLTIDSFDSKSLDSNYWNIFIPENADSNIGFVKFQYDSSNYIDGRASISLNWSIHNNEQWGGLSRIEHFAQNGNLYDFSYYDSISIWYNNTIPSSSPDSTEFRLLLYDASDSNSDSLSSLNTENYYSFHYILSSTLGWNEIRIPLEITNSYDSSGFTLTYWSGITGNAILDKDKIAGFGFEFASTQPNGPNEYNGNILLDNFSVFKKINSFITPPFWVIADSTNYRNLILIGDNYCGEYCFYNIYYSLLNITQENIFSDDVEVFRQNIPRTENYFEHDLISPLFDETID